MSISRANLQFYKTNTSLGISQRAISDVVCTVINESSRTALEYALRCEYRAKKTVKSL